VNIFEWFGILPIDFLNDVCIKSLLNFKLLPFLKTTSDVKLVYAACTKVSHNSNRTKFLTFFKIVAAIPNDYVTQFNHTVPPPLEGFHGFLVSWMKKQLAVSAADHPLVQKLVPYLVKLNDDVNPPLFEKQIRIYSS
jgi:hypothetical protein